MATETIVRKVDDLDGGDADETVEFALDGRLYEIDLSKYNADALRESFAPYVNRARSLGRVKAHSNGGPRKYIRPLSDAQTIRNWAAAQGKPVSSKGRISRELRAEYDAANTA